MSARRIVNGVGDAVKKVLTKPMMLDCGEHGAVRACFVCSHLPETAIDGVPRGMNWERQVHNVNASCDSCNALIVGNKNNWSDEIMKMTGIETMCENCLSYVAKVNGLEAFQ
jgi:hypothetical protein